MDPYQILAQVLPRARSEEELIAMASELGDPPPPAMKSPAAMASPASAGLPMPNSPLMPPQGPSLVPPLTQGESRTTPRLGETLLGY